MSSVSQSLRSTWTPPWSRHRSSFSSISISVRSLASQVRNRRWSRNVLVVNTARRAFSIRINSILITSNGMPQRIICSKKMKICSIAMPVSWQANLLSIRRISSCSLSMKTNHVQNKRTPVFTSRQGVLYSLRSKMTSCSRTNALIFAGTDGRFRAVVAKKQKKTMTRNLWSFFTHVHVL